jgi:hypothetical protein
MNILKPLSILAISAIFLTGCSSSNTTIDESEGSNISVGEGDGEITVNFPDFSSAGEEGEHSAEALEAFWDIADESKFTLIEQGGIESFPMFEEPFFTIYDPKNPVGENWIAYIYMADNTGSFEYDLFEMSAYNAGLELYTRASIDDRPVSGVAVSLNPDGTYTVSVPSEGYSIRYQVENGLIVGRAVYEEDTFMGYSEISYGLDPEAVTYVKDLYDLAIAAGETFVIPEDKKIVEEPASEPTN